MARKSLPVPPSDDLVHSLEMLALADLRPHARNDGAHPAAEIAHLKASLTEHGVYRNVVVAQDGTILAGHGVVQAARELGHTHIAGKRLPYGPDDPQALKVLVGDNHIARLRMQDDAQLLALLEELGQDDSLALLGTGFDEASLAALAEAQGLGDGTDVEDMQGGTRGALPTVSLAERFLVPPFSVLDARQGYWQARKRAWIALGIQSELGRGGGINDQSEMILRLAGGFDEHPAHRSKLQRQDDNGLLGEAQQARSHYKVSPGGSPRDAATVGKDGKTQRGDGTGKPFARTEGSGAPGELAAAYKAQGGKGRLTWPHDERAVADMDETSRKNLAAGRQALTQVNSVFGPPEDAGAVASQTGTSIFDPVLCELAYRWFCPPGGTIFDPFAGGSVRGIVAARLGRAYTGIDLRPEQLAANEAQWITIGAGPSVPDALLAPPQVEAYDDLRIVRDDAVPGGTKVRALLRVLPTLAADEVVYASPAAGFAQIALALAAQLSRKRATIFVAQRQTLHPCTQAAEQAGARIEQVSAGYLSNVQAKARTYCDATGALLLPFGLDAPPYLDALAQIARETGEDPEEVWCVAGSGVLARALRQAWPTAKLCVVVIGKPPTLPEDNIIVYDAPETFEQTARQPPPFASCGHYDAKAWQFVTAHARPGALFWNVAGEPPPGGLAPAAVRPTWVVGDSQGMDTLPLDAAYDFVFTCPPYADLEHYSDDPRDLSTMDFPAFLAAYRQILAGSLARLKEDRFACVVIGDIRTPQGHYRNLVSETIAAMQATGAMLYNEAILVTAVGSLPLRAGIPFETTRKLGKTHQNVLLFIKGDARRATAACGPVDVTQALEAVMQAGEPSAVPDTAYSSLADAQV